MAKGTRVRKPKLRMVERQAVSLTPTLREKQVDKIHTHIEAIAALETATELGVRNHSELDALIFQCRAILKQRTKAV